jgi:hypothetical protein
MNRRLRRGNDREQGKEGEIKQESRNEHRT